MSIWQSTWQPFVPPGVLNVWSTIDPKSVTTGFSYVTASPLSLTRTGSLDRLVDWAFRDYTALFDSVNAAKLIALRY
jgi:hypothetical protein